MKMMPSNLNEEGLLNELSGKALWPYRCSLHVKGENASSGMRAVISQTYAERRLVSWQAVEDGGWPDLIGACVPATKGSARQVMLAAEAALAWCKEIRTGKGEYQAFYQASGASAFRPMVVAPYLSAERLQMLGEMGVCGIDLCGNGLLWVPGKVCVRESGHTNLYPDKRTLGNAYRGKASLVAHMLLEKPYWPSLNSLHQAMGDAGGNISLSQASKSLKILENDLLVSRKDGIRLLDASGLLHQLSKAYTPPKSPLPPRCLRLPEKGNWATPLNDISNLNWAVSGASSVRHFGGLVENGPIHLYVNKITLALNALTDIGAQHEAIRNFAQLELFQTDAPGSYFNQTEADQGIHWASKIQTYLELQAGDARQRDAARGLREKILNGLKDNNAR